MRQLLHRRQYLHPLMLLLMAMLIDKQHLVRQLLLLAPDLL
jgi:hypothetical protein